jgi:hypothetical protein
MRGMPPEIDPGSGFALEILLVTRVQKAFRFGALDGQLHVPAAMKNAVDKPHAPLKHLLDFIEVEDDIARLPDGGDIVFARLDAWRARAVTGGGLAVASNHKCCLAVLAMLVLAHPARVDSLLSLAVWTTDLKRCHSHLQGVGRKIRRRALRLLPSLV